MTTDNVSREKLRVMHLLYEHENWVETLKEALQVEAIESERYRKEGFGSYYGWEWWRVHTPAVTLQKMVMEKILDITLATKSGTQYKVRESVMIKELIEILEKPGAEPLPKEVPKDLFDSIVGHDKVKTLARYAIEADKPVHLVFVGPPASAKTLFLLELARLPESYYCLAQTTTQSGLANLLFTYQPKYLLIDEIDRLTGEHIGVLNSLLATGYIAESKYGKTRTIQLDTKAFAAGIRPYAVLPRDLLSRFSCIEFTQYTEDEFTSVAVTILNVREGVDTALGEKIAQAVWVRNHSGSDIRQCVQIARLCKGDKDRAEEILRILKR